MYDYLIVGSGLYGAIVARELKNAGYKVLIIEKETILQVMFIQKKRQHKRPRLWCSYFPYK